MSETQKSVTDWCQLHYPDQPVEQRLRDVFEEATELAASLNIASLEELLDVVRKSWEKSHADLGDRSQTAGEIGDLRIATSWLASALNIDDQAALDDKMTINRAKTIDTSQARLARKEKIFNPGV